MKQLCFAVLLLGLVTAGHAQNSTFGTISAAGSTCATTNACVDLVLTNSPNGSSGGALITVATNASGNTLQFEISGDNGKNYYAVNATPTNSTTPVTSTTTTTLKVFQVGFSGATNLRVRCSTLAGGTATIAIQSSTASARSGGGSSAIPFAGVPSGACTSTQTAVNTLTGDYYSCNNTAWLLVGPGAAGSAAWNTVTSGTNAGQTMHVGNSSTLDTTGTGVNSANQLAQAGTTGLGNVSYSPLTAPTAPSAALVADGGGNNCTAGAHKFAVMFINANGVTNYGTVSGSVTCDGTHTEVALTSIPAGPTGTTGRNVCAIKAAGTIYYLASASSPTINDNTTTTYTFNTADASLLEQCPIADNSTAGVISDEFGVHIAKDSAIVGIDAGASEWPTDALVNIWGPNVGPLNTYLGTGAGKNVVPNTSNTCTGSFKQGTWNTFVGEHAGLGTVTGCLNVFIGGDTDHDNDPGYYNTFVGLDAGQSVAAGVNSDTLIGERAGANDTAGSNTMVGTQAGQANTSGSGNTYLGYGSGVSGTTGKQNTGTGNGACAGALVDNTNTGSNNTCLGFNADAVGTGANNTAVGSQAGKVLTTGYDNTFVGSSAGLNFLTGHDNTFIGYNAESQSGATAGNYMTKLGMNAGNADSSGLSGSICIGAICTNTAANQGVIGGNNAVSYINTLYLGEGVTFATPTSSTFDLRATGGSGADNAGVSLRIHPGISTGAATPAKISFYSTAAGSTSSTPQTETETLSITAGQNIAVPSGSTLTIQSGATLTCAGGSTCPSGAGTVTTTGSPLSTYLAGFSGATSITGTSAATIDNIGNISASSYTATGVCPVSGSGANLGCAKGATSGTVTLPSNGTASTTVVYYGASGLSQSVGTAAPIGVPGVGSCTSQFVTATGIAAAPTCTTATLAGAQFANQGTTTTVLHGNGSGNPSFTAITASDYAIANTTFTVSNATFGANSCTKLDGTAGTSTVSMTNVATTSVLVIAPAADTATIVGFGTAGGLVIDAWPTAGQANIKVCNQTGSGITTGATLTFNIGAR